MPRPNIRRVCGFIPLYGWFGLTFSLFFPHPLTSFSSAGHLTREQRKRCAFLSCSALMRPDTRTHAGGLGQAARSGGTHQQPRSSDANSNVASVPSQRHRGLGEGAASPDQAIDAGRLLLLTGQPGVSLTVAMQPGTTLGGKRCLCTGSITPDTEEARKQFN